MLDVINTMWYHTRKHTIGMYVERRSLMPRNKYPEETVEKILEVSLKLFLEKGYEQTTILDIVDGLCGLTRGAFYHHFKSKEEVLNALSDRMFYDNNYFDEIDNENGLTGLQKIKKLIKSNFTNDSQQAVNMATLSLLKHPRFLAEFMENNQKVVVPMLEKFIIQGIEDGSIENNNSKALAYLFMFIGNMWLVPSVFPCTEEELLNRIEFSRDLCVQVGFPIFDEEIMKYSKEMVHNLKVEK